MSGIILIYSSHMCNCSERKTVRSFTMHQLDGEKTQIDIYSDPEMIAQLTMHDIMIGKLPGSAYIFNFAGLR